MFNRHFFKMVLGLIGMILLGIMSLFLINAYEKSQENGTGRAGSALDRLMPR